MLCSLNDPMSQFDATDIPLLIKMGFELYNWIRLDNYILYSCIQSGTKESFSIRPLMYTIMIIERRIE